MSSPINADNVILTYNNTFADITRDYLQITNQLYNNDTINKLTDANILEFDDIVNLEMSLNTLHIHLQNIKFKLNLQPDSTDVKNNMNNATNQLSISNEFLNDTTQNLLKTDKLLNKTINDMLPLFMMHLMNNDPESLLNSNTFANTFNAKMHETFANARIHTNTPMNTHQNTTDSQTKYNYSPADDLD